MLHSYNQESQRPVSPMFDPNAVHSQHMVNGQTNGRFEDLHPLTSGRFFYLTFQTAFTGLWPHFTLHYFIHSFIFRRFIFNTNSVGLDVVANYWCVKKLWHPISIFSVFERIQDV